jgi:bifunctional non-homologous end joining protein LigD
LELAGREVVITNPDQPFFPQAGHTKLHLVRYYAAVAEGAPQVSAIAINRIIT